jgi:hypothetical protein
LDDARIALLKVFGEYDMDPMDRLDNIRKNFCMLINVIGPHIRAVKNLIRNDETGL